MEINKTNQSRAVSITGLSGAVERHIRHHMQRTQEEEKKKAWTDRGFHVSNFTVVSLLRFFLSFFSVATCHIRLDWDEVGVLSEPKCPSVCSGKYSLGIKPKPQASTPWNNSLCHSSEICHYNLLNFKTQWWGDKSSGPDAMCLFEVMKSRLRRDLWQFNQSPEWFSTSPSAHLGTDRPRTVEGNQTSHKLPLGPFTGFRPSHTDTECITGTGRVQVKKQSDHNLRWNQQQTLIFYLEHDVVTKCELGARGRSLCRCSEQGPRASQCHVTKTSGAAGAKPDQRMWWGAESALWFFSALQCVSDCLMRPY